jgi:hypothetical protein
VQQDVELGPDRLPVLGQALEADGGQVAGFGKVAGNFGVLLQTLERRSVLVEQQQVGDLKTLTRISVGRKVFRVFF